MQTKKSVYLIAGLLLCGIFAGCSWMPWVEADRNLRNSEKLRVGMTKAQVLEIMGKPVSNEAFSSPDLWYYFVDPVWCDGLDTSDECMPLLFENGRLKGWGNYFYNSYRLKQRQSLKDEKFKENPQK